MTSEKLYQLCLENDETAWTCAYNYVHGFLKQKGVPGKDMEDILHDTLVYFIDGGLKKIKHAGAFKKWLRLKAMAFLIDRHRFQAYRRHEPLETESEEGRSIGENPAIPHVQPNADDVFFLKSALPVVSKALKAIGNECEILLKRYFKARFLGEKLKDVAREMGIQYNTFRTKVRRCHKKLMRQPEYIALLDDYRGV